MKGLQQVIDSQSTKIASLLTERELAALGHADESTGQGRLCDCHVITLHCPPPSVVSDSGSHGNEDGLSTVIQGYMSQIEELK